MVWLVCSIVLYVVLRQNSLGAIDVLNFICCWKIDIICSRLEPIVDWIKEFHDIWTAKIFKYCKVTNIIINLDCFLTKYVVLLNIWYMHLSLIWCKTYVSDVKLKRELHITIDSNILKFYLLISKHSHCLKILLSLIIVSKWKHCNPIISYYKSK